MTLEKTIYYGTLFNFYGELLTKKQQEIFKNYFFDNLSLSEISEIFKISRQAVLDSVNKSCSQLDNYEEKLKILKNNSKIKNELNKILKLENTDSIKKEIEVLIEKL